VKIKADMDGRVIHRYSGLTYKEPPRGGFFFCVACVRHFRVSHFSDVTIGRINVEVVEGQAVVRSGG
jgi:hypothetical protein